MTRLVGVTLSENRFIAARRADGENNLASRNIRNSISLTMWHARRMICASHQDGAGSAGENISLNAAPYGTCATRTVAQAVGPCQRRSGD